MKYILPPYTKENVEKQYKELAKILHPDKGGDKNSFQELQDEKQLADKLCDYYKLNDKFPTVQTNGKRRIKMVRKKSMLKSKSPTVVLISPERAIKLLIEIKKFLR